MVVLMAAHHRRAVVCTSGPEDIEAYAKTLHGPELVVAQVRSITPAAVPWPSG
jgi:hypothetical protein